jgi:hypothetical protein
LARRAGVVQKPISVANRARSLRDDFEQRRSAEPN